MFEETCRLEADQWERGMKHQFRKSLGQEPEDPNISKSVVSSNQATTPPLTRLNDFVAGILKGNKGISPIGGGGIKGIGAFRPPVLRPL